MDTKVISLREAAERLGITAKAIKYRLRARGIVPAQIDGRFGLTLAISEEQFQAACNPVSVLTTNSISWVVPQETIQEVNPEKTVYQETTLEETPPQMANPLASTDSTLAMALELANKTMDALVAERAERELAQQERDRAQRRAEAMELELGAYRRALAESAESLAEERARRMVVEAREAEDKQQLQLLKVDTPARGSGWGQRMRRWFGLDSKFG